MSGEDVCLAIAADFKMNKISYEEAAGKLGQSVQTVYNRISSKRFFTQKTAEHWAAAFGYDRVFLMTGEGQLRKRSNDSIFDFTNNIEVLVFSVDYLFSRSNDAELKQMWSALVSCDFQEFRKIETTMNKQRSQHGWLPMELQKRLEFLKDYDFYL